MVFFAHGVFALLWFLLLAHRPLFEPDEGRYAEIPREMLQGGDWVIPHLDGLVYLEKPPLQYWLTASVYRLLGENEWTARVVPGLSGYLILWVVWWVTQRLYGTVASRRAVLLCVASPLFVLLGHQLTLDMLLTLWLTTCLACFLLAHIEDSATRAKWWMLGCWASMALAVLTKGLIGLLIPGATLLTYALWCDGKSAFAALNARWGALVFSLIVLPWFCLAAYANPAFLRFFFIREHLQRFFTPIEHRPGPWWYFVVVLAIGTLPWISDVIRALINPPSRSEERFNARLLLWIWCVFVFAFFSLSSAKLIPYILPMIPALAILCASRSPTDRRRGMLINLVASLLAAVGIAFFVAGVGSTAHMIPVVAALRPGLYWTIAVLASTASCFSVFLWKGRPTPGFNLLCVGWFLACVSLLLAADRAASLFTEKYVADALRATGGFADPIFAVEEYPQSVPFYLKRTVTLVNYRDELELGLEQQPNLGIETLHAFAERWQTLPQGFAVMPHSTYRALSRDDVPMVTVSDFAHEVLVKRR